MTFEQAVASYADKLAKHLQAGAPESDVCLNSAARDLPFCLWKETGEAWLGCFNGGLNGNKKKLFRFDPVVGVDNWGFDFVVTKYDQKLEQMLHDYRTCCNKSHYISALVEHIEKYGTVVCWS